LLPLKLLVDADDWFLRHCSSPSYLSSTKAHNLSSEHEVRNNLKQTFCSKGILNVLETNNTAFDLGLEIFNPSSSSLHVTCKPLEKAF